MDPVTVNPTDIVFPKNLAERTYYVPNALLWSVVACSFHTLPWIFWLIVAAVVDYNASTYPWWVIGVLFSQVGAINYYLNGKTARITLNPEERTVTHFSVRRRPIRCQEKVPLSNYQAIEWSGCNNRITYVKTPEYVEEIKNSNQLVVCCVTFRETYRLAEIDEFLSDHGLNTDATENV